MTMTPIKDTVKKELLANLSGYISNTIQPLDNDMSTAEWSEAIGIITAIEQSIINTIKGV